MSTCVYCVYHHLLVVRGRRLTSEKGLLKSVEEASIELPELLQAREAFVTGTAAAVTPVALVSSDEGEVELEAPGPVTAKLKDGTAGTRAWWISAQSRESHGEAAGRG